MRQGIVTLVMWGMVLGSLVGAQNAVLIVLEGASRSTFYALMQKNKLPHYRALERRGNSRKKSLPTAYTSYEALTEPLYSTQAVVRLQQRIPSLTVYTVLTQAAHRVYAPSFLDALTRFQDQTIAAPFVPRHSYEVAQAVVVSLEKAVAPFLLILNFTNIDAVVQQTREGGALYSAAIQRTHDVLGTIIAALHKKGEAANTHFLITSNHGYKAKTRQPQADSFVLSTQKLYNEVTPEALYPILESLLLEEKVEIPDPL